MIVLQYGVGAHLFGSKFLMCFGPLNFPIAESVGRGQSEMDILQI